MSISVSTTTSRLDWKFLTEEIPPIRLSLKKYFEDFVVEETPAYLPSGSGEHTYVFFEKKGCTTHQAISYFAKHLKIPRKQIGVAGLKDAQAVTRQWISLGNVMEEDVKKLSSKHIHVIEVNRHGNKLRIGHLVGNRFHIKLRDIDAQALKSVRAVIEKLKEQGVPNYFGLQRFGMNGDNAKFGKDFILGKVSQRDLKVDKEMLWFYVTAYQSLLFNHLLEKRLPLLGQVMEGDLAFKHDSGAVFKVEDVAAEQDRANRFEISPSGPLWGYKMTEPEGEALKLEQEILESEGLSSDSFRQQGRLKCPGARRSLRVPLENIEVEENTDEKGYYIALRFGLPKGSYATSVVREIAKQGLIER